MHPRGVKFPGPLHQIRRGYGTRPLLVAISLANEARMKRDLYAEVSARIVAELEAGAAPSIKPWSATPGANTPCNAVTNRPYSGCNVVPLWMAQAAGYHTPRFVTTPHDETNNLTLGRSPQQEASWKLGRAGVELTSAFSVLYLTVYWRRITKALTSRHR